MKKFVLALFILAVSMPLSGRAYAATEATTLDVAATIVSACTVTATGVTFPASDGTSYGYANGDVTVNCSGGVAYNIALDAGLNYNAQGIAYRNVSDGAGSNIIYGLYKENTSWTLWGDADYDNTYPGGASLADTGSGADQPHTVYGDLNYATVPGTFSDTVNVTVNY